MDAKSYSILHTQLCGVTSTGHIAPWLRAQPEHTQHGHAQQAGARARTRRRQTARAHRAHSTGTHACAAPSAPVRGRPSPAHACVHWLPWAAFTGGCGSPGRAAPPSCPRCPHTAATVPASVHEKRTCAKGARALKRSGRRAASFSGSSWSRTTTKGMARHGEERGEEVAQGPYPTIIWHRRLWQSPAQWVAASSPPYSPTVVICQALVKVGLEFRGSLVHCHQIIMGP